METLAHCQTCYGQGSLYSFELLKDVRCPNKKCKDGFISSLDNENEINMPNMRR